MAGQQSCGAKTSKWTSYIFILRAVSILNRAISIATIIIYRKICIEPTRLFQFVELKQILIYHFSHILFPHPLSSPIGKPTQRSVWVRAQGATTRALNSRAFVDVGWNMKYEKCDYGLVELVLLEAARANIHSLSWYTNMQLSIYVATSHHNLVCSCPQGP